jgi:glycosyltransferase involved in cell wall biosynthesis
MIKNIGFISTRIAGTDGVSLETEKWARVLERNGYTCFYFAGELDRPGDRCFISEEAHFTHARVASLNDSLFGSSVRHPEVAEGVHSLSKKIKDDLYRFIKKFDIHLVIPENALTIPMNIPLGMAITELLAETGMPAIAHHHDFFWERDRFLVNAAGDFLSASFPPSLPTVRHVVINSLAGQSLSYRRGVSSTVVPNVYDFKNPPVRDPNTAEELRKRAGISSGQWMVLQPTRVVPRKWIERSIDLVSRLDNGGRKLVISHASGDEGDRYCEMILGYAEMMKVELVFVHDVVFSCDAGTGGGSFCLGDAYRASDLVAYPSGYEGFGNAFLEAIYYRKPLLVNRYPVFIADIEPLQFRLCLIDGFISDEAVREVESLLGDAALLEETAEHNYLVAAKHFSFEVLEERLIGLVKGFRD